MACALLVHGVDALLLSDLLAAGDRIAVDSLRITPARIEVALRRVLTSASCPVCRTTSHQVHGRCVRIVRELPWAGTPSVLRFSVRRFCRVDTDCSRRIVAEALPGLVRRRARGTVRPNEALVKVGHECGGEPGRRLCRALGITASGDTILRRLRAASPPPADVHNGAVVGVDDFALGRGRRCGTVVVDHESGGVIDLLPDRAGVSLEAWLLARPAAPRIVTRDRSGADAKATTAAAAPGAIQVADRRHLLANRREALVRVLDRHHPLIPQAPAAVASGTSTPEPVHLPGGNVQPESSPLPTGRQRMAERSGSRLTGDPYVSPVTSGCWSWTARDMACGRSPAGCR